MFSKRYNPKRNMVFLVILLMVTLICGWVETGLAEETKIDLEAVIKDTQKMTETGGSMTFIWWIPLEFWQNAFAQNPDVSKADAEFFVSLFKPYQVVAVLEGTIESAKKVTYTKENDLLAKIQLIDGQGNAYLPIKKEDINTGAAAFLKKFKPMVEKMAGKMGKNLYFVLFPSQDNNEQNIIEPMKEGKFSIKLGNQEFKWRLPLASLVPPKTCPTCGEALSGAYKFCPWDGTKL